MMKKDTNIKIGFTYDLKSDAPLCSHEPQDTNAEFDARETVDLIRKGIESGGYRVIPIGNVFNLLKAIPELDVDVIFNICEGLRYRNREAQVPIVLEMFDMPYIGSDGLTMSVTLDKAMTKKILLAQGIPTPRSMNIDSLDDVINLGRMSFPLIVKLRQEGSSMGLDNDSVVHTRKELERRVEYLWHQYNKRPMVVEQFIAGSEFTVPIIGNDAPVVLPTVQVEICNRLDLGEMIYTFERINSPELRYVCPAKITKRFERKLIDLAWRTYKAVGCLDFGRVDFRVDQDNNPYVLEINPLPSLSVEDVFDISPQAAGYDFSAVMRMIIDTGLKRLGFLNKQPSVLNAGRKANKKEVGVGSLT